MRLLPAILLGLLATTSCNGPPGHRDLGSLTSDTLFARAESLYRAGEYEQARDTWASELPALQRGADPEGEALLLTELGLAHWRLGNLTEARRMEERAIALKQSAGMIETLSRSQNALCLVLRDAGEARLATQACEQAIQSARTVGDRLGVAKASGNLGLIRQDLGDLGSAREAFRTMRSAAHELDSARVEANGLANEASVDIWEGDPVPAIARLDSALGMYRRIGYGVGESNALGQLATAHQLTGALDLAFAALDTAIAVARGEGRQGEEGDLLRLMGSLHASAGDWRRAIAQYDQADSILTSGGFEGLRASTHRGRAAAYQALGNGIRAETEAREALRLHTELEQPFDRLDDLLLIAEIEAAAHGVSAATARLAEARRVARALNTRSARLTVSLTEARLADAAQDGAAVRRIVATLRPDLAPWDYSSAWQADALLARAWGRSGPLDSAVAAGRRAVSGTERARASLPTEPLRTAFVIERASVYGDLVLALLRQGRAEEAFSVADRARSRGLMEHLSQASGVSGTIPRETVEGERLLRRIDDLLQRLKESERARPPWRSEAEDPTATSLVAELEVSERRFEAIAARQATMSVDALAILGAAPPHSDDVRAALGPGELLLEYLVTHQRLVVFALSRSGLQVLTGDLNGPALAHRVRTLHDLWGRPETGWRDGLPVSQALYRSLLGPVRKAGLLRDVTRLVIVPMGVLAQLPFAALQDPGTGRYLAQDFAVTLLPVSAALPALRRRAVAASSQGAQGVGMAPFPTELPATLREVTEFGRVNPGAVLRIGPAARESEARKALAELGPVHLATHGTLNRGSPMFSRVDLARPPQSTPHDDGRLEIHELLGLSIRSPLVFLSGCETGRAAFWTYDPARATEALTLAQAVLAAGASNVISTLWRIDDAGAARFAGRFYQALRERPVSEALASAQLALLAEPQFASPYYWGGYLLTGEGRFTLGPQSAPLASVFPSDGRPAPTRTPGASR